MRKLYCVKGLTGFVKDQFASVHWSKYNDKWQAVPGHGDFPKCRFFVKLNEAKAFCKFMHLKRPENTYEVVQFDESSYPAGYKPTKRPENNERMIEPDL